MKITGKPLSTGTFPRNGVSSKAQNPLPHPDLKLRRQTRNRRLKRTGTPVGRRSRSRSRPETPLLKWKIEDKGGNVGVQQHEGELENGGGRKGRRKNSRPVSARKLAAGLWRLQVPETVAAGTADRRTRDRLGFRPAAGHTGMPYMPHHSGKAHSYDVKNPFQSHSYDVKNPFQSHSSVSDAKSRSFCKHEPSFQFPNSAMEGATKWHPVSLETLDEARQIHSHMNRLNHQVSAVAMVSALEAELEQARACMQELEAERRSSKKNMELFLKKVSEERAAWRSREHEKIRAFIDDMKSDLNRERKNRQRLEFVNSKLVNELADAKVSAKRFMQDYEKERKARELIEEVCDELAKEIAEDKAEIEELKRECTKMQEELDDERKMLQMAEVWREERVQMKLVDAKVALESKYSQMNKLVAELETFLKTRGVNSDSKDLREAESLIEAAASVDIQEIKEFRYDPPNPDDIFSVFEEVNGGEPNEREIEPCGPYSPVSHGSKIHTVSPEVKSIKKNTNYRHSDIEEDESGWETVSNLEDQGSSFSPNGSVQSINKNYRNSNATRNGTEWEDNALVTEINELCPMPTKQHKKVSAITKLWRSGVDNYKIISVDGSNGRLSNGRKSNGGIVSSDGGESPDMVGQWSSPEINRGMKGCIEWPRGMQKHSLKAKLMEARIESQKVQLRQVLKQKI